MRDDTPLWRLWLTNRALRLENWYLRLSLWLRGGHGDE